MTGIRDVYVCAFMCVREKVIERQETEKAKRAGSLCYTTMYGLSHNYVCVYKMSFKFTGSYLHLLYDTQNEEQKGSVRVMKELVEA